MDELCLMADARMLLNSRPNGLARGIIVSRVDAIFQNFANFAVVEFHQGWLLPTWLPHIVQIGGRTKRDCSYLGITYE